MQYGRVKVLWPEECVIVPRALLSEPKWFLRRVPSLCASQLRLPLHCESRVESFLRNLLAVTSRSVAGKAHRRQTPRVWRVSRIRRPSFT